MSSKVLGKVHSVQSLGTVDGPGVRYVVFMKGCCLHCGYCHNPDVCDLDGGIEYTPEELLSKIKRFKEYFGENGGVTASGGEPLLQAGFLKDLFELCREQGINTCLDTSGCIFNSEVEALLGVTDRVLLDIKFTDNDQYVKYVGCELKQPMAFLKYLNDKNIPVTVRQVIVPTLNDNKTNIDNLNNLINDFPCIDKAELLPFKKLCKTKYEKMGISFPFDKFNEPDRGTMNDLKKLLKL